MSFPVNETSGGGRSLFVHRVNAVGHSVDRETFTIGAMESSASVNQLLAHSGGIGGSGLVESGGDIFIAKPVVDKAMPIGDIENQSRV